MTAMVITEVPPDLNHKAHQLSLVKGLLKSPFSPINSGINGNLNVLKRKEDAENDEKEGARIEGE